MKADINNAKKRSIKSLTLHSGRIIHLTMNYDTYTKMKRKGADVRLVDKQMMDRKYPIKAKVTHVQFNKSGYKHSEPTFYSMEDEIIWFEELTKNGKLIGVKYEK